DSTTGWELWQTDGTPAGTQLLELVPGAQGSFPFGFVRQGEHVFFKADSSLWRTHPVDGPIRLAPTGDCPRAVGASLLFFAFDPATGWELWRTSGVPGDAALVKEIAPGPASPGRVCLGAVDATLFFGADPDGGSNTELWKSDGSAAGTLLVKDIRPGPL